MMRPIRVLSLEVVATLSGQDKKVPFTNPGTMVLRQSAKDTGGFRASCERMAPESRAERRAFATSIADGSQFRLSVAEQKSACVLTAEMPSSDQWIAHAEDVPHRADKTLRFAVQMAK